jgi:DNA-binding MltR family transcriptional regulator
MKVIPTILPSHVKLLTTAVNNLLNQIIGKNDAKNEQVLLCTDADDYCFQ